jgi:hypothetical protein
MPGGAGAANGRRTVTTALRPPFAGANRKRTGTAQLGNRDKRASRRKLRPEPSVSGPGSSRLNSQDPAKSRSFLGPYPKAQGESPHHETRWRSE